MSVIGNKRSAMELYSGEDDLYSHRTRIVLAEKGVTLNVNEIKKDQDLPQELLEINPYGTVPTLIDRDLVLYDSLIIMEYLDERFPHPPLLPVYPVMRAKARLLMHRIDKDWYSLIPRIKSNDEETSEEAKKQLREALISIAPIFQHNQHFFDDEYTLIDVIMAPLLWRLPKYDIKLPPAKTKFITPYMDKIFARDAFQASLTESEREIRN